MQPRRGGSTVQDRSAATLFAGPGDVRALCRSMDESRPADIEVLDRMLAEVPDGGPRG